MKVVDIENIKIPSINNKYGYNPKSGKLYLNGPYREFKKLLVSHCVDISIAGPYSVSIFIEGYLDIDNAIKVTLDAIQEKGVIDDDKNVLELNIIKVPAKRGTPGSIAVYVDPIKKYIDKIK